MADLFTVGINPTCDFSIGATYTLINIDKPATGTGKITQVHIAHLAASPMTGVKVAIFYCTTPPVGPATYYEKFTARDSETIGDLPVSDGIKTFDVDLDVVEGDFIGLYWAGGSLRGANNVGCLYYRKCSGDQTGCANQDFYYTDDDQISIYGTGETPAEGGIHIFFTLSDF